MNITMQEEFVITTNLHWRGNLLAIPAAAGFMLQGEDVSLNNQQRILKSKKKILTVAIFSWGTDSRCGASYICRYDYRTVNKNSLYFKPWHLKLVGNLKC